MVLQTEEAGTPVHGAKKKRRKKKDDFYALNIE